jgi:choline dehydrogenase-like flavoprotein
MNDTSANRTTPHANGTTKSAVCSVEEFVAQKYDYIIVGGGTAGLVVAARLTENSDVTVGVIEAGKDRINDELILTPSAFPAMIGNKDYDWCWKTTPQVSSRARN